MYVSFLEIIFFRLLILLSILDTKDPCESALEYYVHCLLRMLFYNRFGCHSSGIQLGAYNSDDNLNLYMAL